MRPGLAVQVPTTWERVGTGYSIDGVTIAISDLQALPDDPAAWLAAEFQARGTPTITAVESEAGYPALIGEAELGDTTLMIVVYQLLELGAVATVHGPHAAFEARRAEIRQVLMAARPRWGVPVTLSGLLAGAETTKGTR